MPVGVGLSANIRGSSGMLLGNALALSVSFLVQVLIVRHLTKEDYGAFAWALSAVLLVQAFLPLGLDRANTRFLALYDERKDYGRLYGFMMIEAIVILGIGGLVILAVSVFGGPLTELAPSSRAVALLAVLIALAPIQALDIVVVEAFAVFASPWSVFFRRYILEPSLRLTVVLLMLATGSDSRFLTTGYVVAGVAALVLYIGLEVRLFIRTGLAAHFRLRQVRLPWREVGGFCGPLLLTSLVAVATTELAAVVLGHTSGATAVASFRAVQPFAALNLVVMFSFTTLFTPAASRLAARGDRAELSHLYWRTAAWISVLTFPVLAVTTAYARPFTVFTIGERYSSSAPVLAILAIGYFINAALGFNGLTVQILGRVWWVLITNVVTLTTMVVATVVLVSLFGAIGAATAVLVTLTVHNVLKQVGLGFGAGVGMWRRSHAPVPLHVGLIVLVLWLSSRFVQLPLFAGCALVFVLWIFVIRRTRHVLQLAETFPEITRWPALRWLVA
jgi:O-antigen/teichoic acid export membrane protein